MSWYIEEQSPVYLDYNATTPVHCDVKKSIIDALDQLWANPSSDYIIGKQAKVAIEAARNSIALLVNAPTSHVIFTSGGTEANNWVIQSAIEEFNRTNTTGQRPHIITLTIEHPSIIEPLRQLHQRGLCDTSIIDVNLETGAVLPERVAAAVNQCTCLVSIMLANNETGVIQPISEIVQLVRAKSSTVMIHTDAAQAIGKIPVDMTKLNVDSMTIVGHKFYGPRIGALIVNADRMSMHPLLYGGGQERSLRSGTENTPMIVGLGCAADLIHSHSNTLTSQLLAVRDYFETKLKDTLGDSHVRINFDKSSRLPNTSSVGFLQYEDGAAMLIAKCKTFYASVGAACHSDNKCASRVLISSGIDDNTARKTIRFSIGQSTTIADIDRVVAELKALTFLTKYGNSLLGAMTGKPIAGF